jgi:hypothetical protein
LKERIEAVDENTILSPATQKRDTTKGEWKPK